MDNQSTESDELKMYNALVARKEELDADLKTVTHIYGKVTSSHDYKEFAAKTNLLMQRIQFQVKEIGAKITQWDNHFKAQQAYQEMMAHEAVINSLCDKYIR